jgi:hypothetical protein
VRAFARCPGLLPLLVVQLALAVVAGDAHRPEVSLVVMSAGIPLGGDDVTHDEGRRLRIQRPDREKWPAIQPSLPRVWQR